MFDRVTEELIRSAPKLTGVDAEGLSLRLTRAFARIVEVRVRVAAGAGMPADLADEIDELRALALAYEALVVCGSVDVRGAAFVAASAYQLLATLQRVLHDTRPPDLTDDAVSFDLAACLLFLGAGYIADAREAAARLRSGDLTGARRALVEAIQALVRGDLAGARGTEVRGEETGGSSADTARELLWQNLLHGIRILARQIGGEATDLDPVELFAATGALAAMKQERANDREGVVVSLFAGPHHLAALLQSAGTHLLSVAVSKQPPPRGLDPAAWKQFVDDLAKTRPFLWENHIGALAAGYLDVGVSAVATLPTGAGKSTLAELKIAATLLSGKKAVFLVPTHALIRQVTENLERLFPGRVGRSLIVEGYYAEVDATLPDVAVLTPERCLTLLGVEGDSFRNVGLVIFDECHLLDGSDENDRRALDAMLCLLMLLDLAPATDMVLMSAMLAEADKLAAWLATITGRPTLPLSSPWKPTRQARGCVVFPQEQLGRGDGDVLAIPHALYCLHQTWQSESTTDYYLSRVLEEHVPLTRNSWGKVTANRNVVAGRISGGLGASGIKTLVFVQNRQHCSSLASSAGASLPGAPPLSAEEGLLWQVAVDEVGAKEYVYAPEGRVAVHHGLLLPSERRLNEALFERPDGLQVLVATPTLAQGMNLPAEAVVLAGDDRHDEELGTAVPVPAHELLNAAGRAGRAGLVAQGIVLVVPSDVAGFDLSPAKGEKATLGQQWWVLKKIFEQADQCLVLVDPLTRLLDEIASGKPLTDQALHLLLRLPVDEGGDAHARRVLSRSLAAFHAAEKGAERDFAGNVEVALRRRDQLSGKLREDLDWRDDLAARSGVPPWVVRDLDAFVLTSLFGPLSVVDLTTRLLDWFAATDERWAFVVESTRLVKDLKAPGLAVRANAGVLASALAAWVAGASLLTIEPILAAVRVGRKTKNGTAPAKSPSPMCEAGRRFALRCTPSIAYLLGLAAMVARHHAEEDNSKKVPTTLACLGACIREGVASPALLAVRYQHGASRKRTRELLTEIEGDIRPLDEYEPFAAVARAVRDAG